MSDEKYTLTIDLQVLNHLGLNLYSNTPAVLSEAVANAWDADATRVDIKLEEDFIRIEDDGSGMSLEDINNKYLTVGYQKRREQALSPVYNRPVMGRKGIGKLSLFSIANIVEVYSKKDMECNGFKIDTNDLKNAILNKRIYNPTELSLDSVNLDHNGTIIILRDLKKRRTGSLQTHLRQRLARRFSVINDNNFKIYIDDKPIKVSDRNYLSKAQCLWIFPPDEDGEKYKKELIQQADTNKLKQVKTLPSAISVKNQSYSVTGWIATCSTPTELDEDDSENINRIVIMVRGKMAKEDIFSELGTTALYSKYVYGELSADFLDLDNEEDITTSSRQDFFEDDERYIELKKFVKGALTRIRSEWEEFRSAKGVDEACKYQVIKKWYNSLQGDYRASANKLFGKINQLTVSNEDKKELFKHGILAFESFKLKTELSQLEKVSVDNMQEFLNIVGRLDNIEATMYYQIVQERLAVIKKMEQVVSDGSLEKVIQSHLAKNLWLLDPSWDRGTEVPVVERAFKTLLGNVNSSLSKEELDSRLDIKYKKASNMHLIIELKKGDRIVKTDELQAQVRKYFSATTKLLKDHNLHEPFQIIVLLGRKLDGAAYDETVYHATERALQQYNCRIMYYNELLVNAQNLYKDFLVSNEKLAAISDIIKEVDVN